MGSYHEPDTWFAEIAYRIEEQVVLQTDVPQWWAANAHRGAAARFMRFLEQVLLKETGDTPIVIIRDIVTTTSAAGAVAAGAFSCSAHESWGMD